MKKLLVLFCMLTFSVIPVLAEYKPIPVHLSKQYKAEMESIIDEEYPTIIKDIDDLVKEAKLLHDKLLKYGYNFEDYNNLQLSSEIAIWGFDGALDTKLIKFTQNKYFNYHYEPVTIDDFYTYRDYLYRNFKENNVDTKKIKEIIKYESSQNKIIEEYIRHIQNTVLPSED